MLALKLTYTCVFVVIIVSAALVGDYVTNELIFHTPQAFTPVNTMLLATVVGTPLSYYLIGQRFNVQHVQDQLAASVAEKERAVVEIQLRRQEAERAQAIAERGLARLAESEALYRLLADNQTDVISLWTADLRRIYTSPSAERALGYTAAELLEQPDLFNVHPDDVAVVPGLVAPLTAGGPARSAEFRLIRKDGSAVWVEGTFKRLEDGGGGLISTTRVITERKALEQELVGALDEAKAAVRAKSDFLANMTHELRTPLNAIIGFSGVLKDDDELGARSGRQVDLIWDASRTLLGIVNDVLDFSKLEAGAVELDLHPFDPRRLADSTVSLLAGQASVKGLTLSVASEGLEGPLIGDSARLRQVLLNLLSNAIKFTARGEVAVLVRQTAEGEGRRLHVAVRDSGIGMTDEQLGAIFDRFTQADASVSRQYGGTGLGLAISRRIVEAMGGVIGVASTLGEGSSFWFEVSLPRAGVGAVPGQAAEPGPPVAIRPALRLLVVDDNAVNRELITTLLAPFDLEIETAADGVDAIEAVSHAPFDLILMDVQMPNMDGLTATRRIRAAAAPGAPRTPIIAMTANVLPEQVDRCLAAGMDDHLGKPINPQKLLEALDRWSGPEGGEADQIGGSKSGATA